jgi:hypothetical protein
LIRSIKGLIDVVAFLFFVFLLFGVIGLQWFNGAVHFSCRVGTPVEGDTYW